MNKLIKFIKIAILFPLGMILIATIGYWIGERYDLIGPAAGCIALFEMSYFYAMCDIIQDSDSSKHIKLNKKKIQKALEYQYPEPIDYNEFKDYNITLTYEDVLNTTQWKEKSKNIKERDNYTCKFCGAHKNLQVHHKYYLQYPNNTAVLPWQYPDDAMITLCDKCHKKVHDCKTIKKYYKKFQ